MSDLAPVNVSIISLIWGHLHAPSFHNSGGSWVSKKSGGELLLKFDSWNLELIPDILKPGGSGFDASGGHKRVCANGGSFGVRMLVISAVIKRESKVLSGFNLLIDFVRMV